MDTFGQLNFPRHILFVAQCGSDLETQGEEGFWESGLIWSFELLILLDSCVWLRPKGWLCLYYDNICIHWGQLILADDWGKTLHSCSGAFVLLICWGLVRELCVFIFYFLNMGVMRGIVQGAIIMNRTQEMPCIEGHKKYKQPQRRSYIDHLYMKIGWKNLNRWQYLLGFRKRVRLKWAEGGG